MAKDPICGMEVENGDISFEFDGKKYFFCSRGCLEKFKQSQKEFSKKQVYDLIVIGGGPAGLTAAVYASVLKIHTFLITMDIGGQAIDSSKIKNYMGYDFISGKELIGKFRNQFLRHHFLEHKIEEALKIEPLERGFKISTKNSGEIITKAVIIASGMKRRNLGIPGEEKFQRRGIFYSLVQDIALFNGSEVVVVGGGNSGVQTVNQLKKIVNKIILVSKGRLIADSQDVEELRGEKKVEILEGYNIDEILGDDKVEGVKVSSSDNKDVRKINAQGVFIQIGFLPNTEFCRGLVEFNKIGEIVINPDCSTSRKGIFACGDVTNAFGKRIVIASGEGAKAVLSAKKYLNLYKGGEKNG